MTANLSTIRQEAPLERVGDLPMLAPLLKWPGGKRALLKHILPLVPKTFNCYYEPFLGGGALFFALQSPRSVLSDNNAELINCYTQVRDNPSALLGHLSKLENNEEAYYAVRNGNPTDNVARAARLIYLTTLSFNGIHRVNLQGRFNVPYGRKAHLQPCDTDKIQAASIALASAALHCNDFEAVVEQAQSADFVYLDPPYTVAHGNNGFIKYNSKIFSWDDQIRLARVAKEISRRGCHVIVSNADHPSIHSLYHGFRVVEISRYSIIAASRQHRRSVVECIFHNME